MEDIRPYRIEEDDDWYVPDDEREWSASTPAEDEVPFHIPRD